MGKIGKYLLLSVTFLIILACFLTGNRLVDSNANAHIWNDMNADGIMGPEDTPIEGIKVCATTNKNVDNEAEAEYCYYSDKNGDVPSSNEVRGMFFPGTKCQDIFIFIILPENYLLSTQEKANGCVASFGLIEVR